MILALVLVLVVIIAIFNQPIRLYLQISRYKDYWQKQNQATPPANALIYVALGDSTAQGIGASLASRGYVGLLAEQIGAKTARPVYVVNLSVSGAKVADVLNSQLPRLAKLDAKPDIITLGIGANNMNHYDPQAFRSDFVAVLGQLPKTAVVADIAYFGSGRHPEREPGVLEANKIINQAAAAKGMALAPLHKTTLEKDNPRIQGFDNFHPSDYGYQVWAEAFWPVLEPYLL